MEWHRGRYTISTDRARLDIKAVHAFLSTSSYWAQGRSFETVARAVENSLPFGLYDGERLLGFARVVTDHATFAWLADVYVLEEFRGEGLGKFLVETVLDHPDFRTLRRWLLGTRDAHGLYRRFGFTQIEEPQFYMHRVNTNERGQPSATTTAATDEGG
ncbi:MAG TPA: GNAT family N-acetyltransferase [Pyrinomonadaceae bacterium]